MTIHSPLLLAAAAAIIIHPLPSFAQSAVTSPLLTSDQAEAHRLAASLRNNPAITAAQRAARDRLAKARPAALADGKSTLDGALDELVNGVVLAAANNDPARPKVIWSEHLPYTDGKFNAPGTRYGGDSTDRIYRSIAASPAYRYEIKGQRDAAHPSLDFSFEAIPLPSLWGQAKAALPARDVDVAADGSFTITVDNSPTNGRRNHLQLPNESATILVRDTLSDWHTQLPNRVTVRRIDNAPAPARSEAAAVQDAVAQIDDTVGKTLEFLDDAIWKKPANELTAFERTLKWGVPGGVLAVNRFSIKDDEALIITLDPIAARYLSIEVTDPWLRSAAYSKRPTSFNNTQAIANADGTFTYVLALKDVGARNWLDTGDLHDGILLVRWEQLPGKAALDKAVREVRKVKLSEIASALPDSSPKIARTQREKLLAAREKSYRLRLAQAKG